MKKILLIIVVILGIADFGSATEPPTRIVSLSPATTEILFAIGLGDRIVGVTSFCDYPREARDKAKVGGMSNPSLEAIVALRPDIVVMTTDGNPREVEGRLRSMNIRTYVWTERVLGDLSSGIRRLAVALGADRQGDLLAGSIDRELHFFESRQPETAGRKKVLYVVWPEPLLVAGPGTAINDAIALLGLENIAGSAASPYPRYSLEEVIREAPEMLFIGGGSGMDMRGVSQGILKKLATVPAVINGRVCYVSDHLYRLAPRAVDGIGELARCMQ